MSKFSESLEIQTRFPQRTQKEGVVIDSAISKRSFFTKIRNIFGLANSGDENTEQPQNNTKLNRRELLKRMAAATATLTFGGHLIRNNITLNRIVVDGILTNFNEPLAANISKDTDALDAYAKTVADYKGPIRFDISQNIAVGDTNWTDDEYTRLRDMIDKNKRLLEDIFGIAAVWTNDETVLITKDFIRYLERNEQEGIIHAVFMNGDAFSKFIFSKERQERFKKINILCVPKDFISPNEDDQFAMSPENAKGYIAHEMSHAINQDFDYLPVMVYEGMAQMTFYKNSEEYWKSYHIEQLGSTEEDADAFAFELLRDSNSGDVEIAKTVDISKTFTEIGKFNPRLQASYYRGAGYLFYQYYREHPDFFRNLRSRENEFYVETGKKPTYKEWQHFGEEISPGFKSWLESYPLFSVQA